MLHLLPGSISYSESSIVLRCHHFFCTNQRRFIILLVKQSFGLCNSFIRVTSFLACLAIVAKIKKIGVFCSGNDSLSNFIKLIRFGFQADRFRSLITVQFKIQQRIGVDDHDFHLKLIYFN